MWNLKRNDTNELTYKTNRFTDLEKELMVVGKRGKVEGRMGEGIVREFVHIAIF